MSENAAAAPPHQHERFPLFDGLIAGAWLYTGDRLIRNGAVRIDSGQVAEILEGSEISKRRPGEEPRLEFPSGLLHPGLVNAHAHLDLSGLSGKFAPGAGFIDWLERVRAWRLPKSAADLRKAAGEGLEELARGGVTAVADFSFEGVSEEALLATPMQAILFREVIGLEPERRSQAIAAALEWLERRGGLTRLSCGLAPHAPYSAHPETIQRCHAICAGKPFSIHLAEDPAEREFLRDGGGPFQELLSRLGIPGGGFRPPGLGPIAYLESLGVLDGNTLLIHANDLLDAEIGELAGRGAAVVFCPGTQRFFRRPPHPLPRLLEAGVPAGVGTDSSASTGGLSMAGEMREARRQFPDLPPGIIFSLGTGRLLERFFPGAGRLVPGWPATLAVADLGAAARSRSPLEEFLQRPAPNRLTLCAGRILFQAAA
ncbi:MAG: amidohydrolase family protein [Planctomycetes bacterium]|nr:amidohydrolase family protein [Planctomycetota bacterium]